TLEALEDRAVPAQFFVSNTNDQGAGSLRAAVTAANNNAGTDDVVFQAGVTGVIRLSGPIAILDGVRMTGPGANLLTIQQTQAAPSVFVLTAFDPTARVSYTVSISGLTFTGGGGTVTSDDTFNGGGGAIYSFGKMLTIDGCEFDNNLTGGNGGALLQDGSLGG